MKLNSVVAGVLGALALGGLSGTAAAVTTNLGAATIGVPLTFGGGAPVGSFIDDFLFSLPTNGGSGYSVLNFSPAFLPAGSFNTVFSAMALYSNPDGTPWNGDESLVTSVNGSGGGLSFTWGPTAAGNMILQVAGATNGTFGGLYTGGIQVSPVPEPATWAMMATGAILLGFGLRRNRS